LPAASAVRQLAQAPIIAVDDHGVFLDGRTVTMPSFTMNWSR